MNLDNSHTESGIPLKPVFSSADLPDGHPSMPGEWPFTRGIQPEMYRGKLWTMRQYAGFSTARESNERYHYLLEQGVTGLSVAFDLPTQIGYDSDHSLSDGEVGKVGVPISTIEDMEELFKDLPLEKITTSMTINATAFILLAFYVALAKKRGNDLMQLSGTIQNDILKEYVARGTYIYPPKPSMKIITDLFEWCTTALPRWNTISISGYHIREAGSTAAQELAFTLSNGKAYVKAALEKGLDIDLFGKRLSFFFNAHNNFFEEIAKFRAARTLWANIMKDLGAKDPRAMMLRFHTQTAGSTLLAQQPLNNIARVTLQGFAAIMGGTQSLHTNAYDEALGLPTEAAASIALRTQQILAFESGAAETADPLAGSYYVEYLTHEMEQRAANLIRKIDDMGGSIPAIESGFMQDEIGRSAFAYQKSIEENSRIVVGLNKFTAEQEQAIPILKVEDHIRKERMDKLARFRAQRDNLTSEICLKELHDKATTGQNIMPAVISAVENNCTLGEIADTLRKVYGEYR